ncbi:MAG TPA: MarR family transcriptional regulator [Kineosporiaceae bacterium]|nr:MarR family transcriptional regulator [Kineosporiaceae bacterium]
MGSRRDLGVAFAWLTKAMFELELPLLRERGLEMWDYAVLDQLADGPAPTQGDLAAAVGRDPTRLIPILDRLEQKGLLQRLVDPADRRSRTVVLSEPGRELLAACKQDVATAEQALLAHIEPDRRAAFVDALDRLASAVGPGR